MTAKNQRTGIAAPADGGRSRSGKSLAVEGTAKRRRLPPRQREQMILDDATRFFAEFGFEANIRDLARHAGVSQGLIFKYFGSKERLVERVYERTFLQRWRPDWERNLADKQAPIEVRLANFYKSYLRTVDEYVWIRIALFSGLSGNNLTTQYIQENVTRLMHVIALELRASNDEPADPPIDPLEMEQVWMLHSTFIYYLIRKHVFKTPTAGNQDEFVDVTVRNFLSGRLPGR